VDPAEVMDGATVAYDGSNATNSRVTGDLQIAVQRVVQSERLRHEGIDEARSATRSGRCRVEITEDGRWQPGAARVLAFGMAFAIYIVVIMYGQSIMTSVQEEKRDRIVELIVSSVRARDLLLGKVIGIGAAGVLQMLTWVARRRHLLLTWGATLAGGSARARGWSRRCRSRARCRPCRCRVGVAFVLYFAGGFFLFATLFALIGAIITNAQEAQQFVFPVLMPFMIGLFIAMPAAENPNSTVAVIGSLRAVHVGHGDAGARERDHHRRLAVLALTAAALRYGGRDHLVRREDLPRRHLRDRAAADCTGSGEMDEGGIGGLFTAEDAEDAETA
jgi:ABC-2 type transport system permease protein